MASTYSAVEIVIHRRGSSGTKTPSMASKYSTVERVIHRRVCVRQGCGPMNNLACMHNESTVCADWVATSKSKSGQRHREQDRTASG